MNKDKIIKAGKIAVEVKKLARSIVKKDVLLLEIAEKIEAKIVELGGKPAFPTNLSINDIAAHFTPTYNDETKAHGLLKVDFGVHVDGWTADTAFSVDLENSEKNKKLIEASEKALEKAIETIKVKINSNEIGAVIGETIEEHGFSPIVNLSGHEMKHYDLHAGVSIPNFDDNHPVPLGKGLYAIEPFATGGSGKVYDGKPSGIYIITDAKNVRSPIAREVLALIGDEYVTLPFCSRWVVNKLGPKALFGLKQLENNGNLHHFPQLVEASHANVSQTENTILLGDENIITTE